MENTAQRFLIAVIGASAGGIPALELFFAALPPDTGVAFVLIMHLPTDRASHLAEVVETMTAMRARVIEDGQVITPDTVHVGPPGFHVSLSEGVAHLTPFADERIHLPIDWTMRSLAEDQGENAVAIVLSGYGAEGTAGLLEVKQQGGVAFVQDPISASAPSMPQSAILTRLADFVLEPGALAVALASWARGTTGASGATEPGDDAAGINAVIAVLRQHTRYDFQPYKRGTLVRRIHRRMALRHMERIGDYVQVLQGDREEIDALARDLLIRVTHFFRDPEAWEALASRALLPLIEAGEKNGALRIWVPGCATGQEAYSLAMLALELITARPDKAIKLQVFATDIGQHTAAYGRDGIYAISGAELSPARLARFFVRLGDGRYQVAKALRECVVFAEQDLISDPPFSRMDLIICRNVLIYVEPEVQQKVVALFHFGLVPGGYLFLGPAESVGQHGEHFVAVHKRWRIFQRVGATRPRRLELAIGAAGARLSETARPEPRETSFARLAQQVLLERFAPAAVLISVSYDILFYCGPTNRYLTQPAGSPTHSLLELAPHALRSKIRGAVLRAAQQHESVSVSGATGAGEGHVDITVSPVSGRRQGANETLLLVTFKEADERAPPRVVTDLDDSVIAQLEHELGVARDDLKDSVERLETSNQELKAANEEVTSMNEELQSTNEELETSKEELQSVNEELTTVNAQLQYKIEEAESTTADLQNLLASTHIATLFLDLKLRIKRYTPAVTELLHLIPGDVGRAITDFSHEFVDGDLAVAARRVLETLEPAEAEVQVASKRWFLRRILPYRTDDQRVAGVVVTFSDFTARKHSEEALRASEESLRQAEAEARALAATLEERVTERSALVRLLSDAAIIANQARDADDALRAAIERLCGELGYRAGHVWKPAARADGLVDAGIWWGDLGWSDVGALATQLAGVVQLDGLARDAQRAAEPRLTLQVADVGWLDAPLLHRWPVRAVLALPMVARGEGVGVIELLSSDSASLSADELGALAAVGEQLGSIVARAAAEQAAHDLAAELAQVQARERGRVAAELDERVGDVLDEARRELAALGARVDPDVREALSRVTTIVERALGAARALTRP